MDIDDWLDDTFEWFNGRFDAGDFEAVDLRLQGVNVLEMNETQLVGFLTCSLWAKDKLPHRAEFVARCKKHLERVEPDAVNEIMKGLE